MVDSDGLAKSPGHETIRPLQEAVQQKMQAASQKRQMKGSVQRNFNQLCKESSASASPIRRREGFGN